MKTHYVFPDVRITFCEYLHEWRVEVENENGEWDKLLSFFDKQDAIEWARDKNNLKTDWFDL